MFGSLMEMNQLFFLKLLAIFNCVDVTGGIVTRSDVIDQLTTVLLFYWSDVMPLTLVLVLDVTKQSGYQGVTMPDVIGYVY